MFHSFLSAFLQEEEGQDLVEYALLVAFLAIGCISIMTTLKTSLSLMFTNINTKVGTISNAAT